MKCACHADFARSREGNGGPMSKEVDGRSDKKKEGPHGPSVKREKERGLPQLLAGTRVRPSRKVSFLLIVA